MSRHFCYEGDDCAECTYSPVRTALEPVCTCPQFDVTTLGQAPGSETVKGYSAACPVCPNPYVKARTVPPVDVSWVTLDRIGSDWAWPWWLAVPAAALRRWLL